MSDWTLEREVAYGKHAIRRITRELAWSGILASSRDGHHGLQNAGAWWSLLGVPRPRLSVWLSWASIYLWTAVSDRLINRAITRDVTSYGLGAQLDELAVACGPLLPASGPLRSFPDAPTGAGITGFVRRCEDLIGVIPDA